MREIEDLPALEAALAGGRIGPTRLSYAEADAVLPVVVLVGRRHWTDDVPVWPPLTALASERPMAERLHLVDSVDEAADLVVALSARS